MKAILQTEADFSPGLNLGADSLPAIPQLAFLLLEALEVNAALLPQLVQLLPHCLRLCHLLLQHGEHGALVLHFPKPLLQKTARDSLSLTSGKTEHTASPKAAIKSDILCFL